MSTEQLILVAGSVLAVLFKSRSWIKALIPKRSPKTHEHDLQEAVKCYENLARIMPPKTVKEMNEILWPKLAELVNRSETDK